MGAILKKARIAPMQKHITSLHDGSEYGLSESHKIVKSSLGEREKGLVEQNKIIRESRGKEITVTVEFPTTPNEKAEEEFNNLLKALFLKKFEIGSMQNRETALSCPQFKETEDKNHE